jgi:hypothetical protein
MIKLKKKGQKKQKTQKNLAARIWVTQHARVF